MNLMKRFNFFLCIILLLAISCGDDDSEPELVTITVDHFTATLLKTPSMQTSSET